MITGARRLTVDVRRGRVIQARGWYNRQPRGAEMGYLKKWARRNRVVL